MVLCAYNYIVAGPVEPSQLGVTLPHEHILLDFTGAIMDPGYCSPDELSGLKLTMKNLGKIRQFPYVVCTPYPILNALLNSNG